MTPKPLRPSVTNFWSNTDRFAVSQLKAYYGTARDQGERLRLRPPSEAAAERRRRLRELELGVHLRPHVPRRHGRLLQLRHEPGEQRPALAQGDRRAGEAEVARRRRELRAGDRGVLARRHPGARRTRSPRTCRPKSSCCRRRTSPRRTASFVNSARWIQWKWKAVDPPGDAKPDQEIIGAHLPRRSASSTRSEGGTFPGSGPQPELVVLEPDEPVARRGGQEINGWALEDVQGRDRRRRRARRAAARRGSSTRAPTASTLSGNWLYIGMYTDAGNLTQRRSIADPSGLGRYPEWAFSWPANRRVLYNRCSADAQGRPWDPVAHRHRVERAALDGRRAGLHGRQRARRGPRRVHHAARGRGAAVRARPVRRGPVVRALRAGRVAGREPAASGAELQPGGAAVHAPSTTCSARPSEYPIVCTTYRLTEHFHYWTKNNPYSVQLQPEFFVEIPEELAREKGIANGDRVRVHLGARIDRGPAMVTRRIKPMQVAGKTVVSDRVPDSLGLPRPRSAARIAGEPGDADHRRSELVRARVQGLPREAGEGVTPRARCASRRARPPRRECACEPIVVEARRHLDLHRLQGVRGGVPGVERPAAGADGADGHLPDAARDDGATSGT